MDAKQGPSPRRALKAARERFGWGQEEAAEAVRVSVSTWSRWERGVQDVRPAHRARLAEVFNAGPEEVARWVGAQASGEPTADPAPASPGATVADAVSLWRADADLTRRADLADLAVDASAWPEWLLHWTLDPGPGPLARAGRRVRVGPSDIARIEEATRAFAAMDRRYGGGMVRPAVVDFLHAKVTPLLAGTYDDAVGASLMSAAATMTGLAGWEAYDLRHDGLAQRLYGHALGLAKAAGDAMTAAWVLTVMAQQAIDLAQPVWAIRLARAAREAGRAAGAPPRVRAALALREARATAVRAALCDTPDRHAVRRVERLLGEVDRTFAGAAPGDPEPHWISNLGHAEIAAEAGCAWRLIGEHVRAADCARTALAGFGAAYPRSAQFNVVHHAQALHGQGALDEALSVARPAVPMANGLSSHRSLSLLRSFTRSLTPHRGHPLVREWRDYLAAELAPAA
ncbi:helix-turn-helix transcriptional regulator [Actinocorallia sp. A-T 12471]|uniref:helix-turn-helix domain-containing protein n=1 Tax=Actinocorallia sp. A-T 12471 TaxID=3089813 RepID=UPI0029CBAA8E|nr:helix-turn-helix transcriptional regulator [Actinocorallia sp. A-T 12471]MDX6744777.1 helix-turn-helix transcriptional regulator [Actinocorallia sp. A-T 12471]